MTTAVSKKETTNLSIVQPQPEQQVLVGDVIVPNIYLMQAMSQAVLDQKARMGQMIRSTTLESVGDDKKGVNFIPLKMVTHWIEQEKVGQKFEYRKRVDRTPANENSPWTFYRNPQGEESATPFPGATEWNRVKTISVYALLKEDVEAYNAEMKKALDSGDMPDLTKSLLPVMISFRSTSFQAGRKVVNYYLQYNDMKQYNPNLKSYGYFMELSCKQEKNDKGTFYVLDVGAPKKLPEDLMSQASRWYNYIQGTADVKVDDSSLDAESSRVGEKSKF